MDSLAAPKTAATPASDKTCADALAGQACDAFLTGVEPPAACLPQHGAGGSGAACAFAAECASGFCSVADDAPCGTCGDPPAAGASCATSGCGPTLTCVKTTQLCQAPGAAGAACDKDLPCLAGLACVGATMTAMGACQAAVATAGAACDPKRVTGPDCDAGAGLVCDTQSLTCVAQPVAAANQPCGVIGTTRTACGGGATCSIPQGETMGVCVAPAPDGGACNVDSAPDCQTPARCVNGTCQLPGTMTCS